MKRTLVLNLVDRIVPIEHSGFRRRQVLLDQILHANKRRSAFASEM